MKHIFLLLLPLLLFACGARSIQDYRTQTLKVVTALNNELAPIQTRDQLVEASPAIKKLFHQLVDTLIAAQEYRKKHPDEEIPDLTPQQEEANHKLRAQMNRLYQIEGARTLLEKYQEEAIQPLIVTF